MSARPSPSSQRGLDWLSFFIADVETGFGPFISVYLVSQNWSPGEIGLILAIGGIAGIASQVPGGALVDAVPGKRLLIGIAVAMLAAGSLMFALWPSFWPIVVAELLVGAAGGVIKPALSAIGLGLVGHRRLSGRLGRNQRFNSFGNGLTAGLMGLLGQLVSKRAPFFAAAALCVPTVLSLAMIRGEDIDYARARSAADRNQPRRGHRWRELLRNRPLQAFVLCLVLFQVANASIVPLAGARVGSQNQQSELFVAGFVIVPQLAAALIAGWVARRADQWGHKPLLLVGLGAMTVRALVFGAVAEPLWLVPVQLLDGLSAAIIGVMTPLVIAELTRGSGRYNLAQGFAGTATGLGASLSTGASGYLVEYFGYLAGFFSLAAIGLAGCAVVYFLLPETQPDGTRPAPRWLLSLRSRTGL